MENYINLKFPFNDSDIGYLLEYNKDSINAIKSDILHIVLTKKGSRFFKRDFGTNLYTYLFEQNDTVTLSDIKVEANDSLEILQPNVEIKNITATQEENTIFIYIELFDKYEMKGDSIGITIDF